MTTSAHYEVVHLCGGCAVALIAQYQYTRWNCNGKRRTAAHGWYVEKWSTNYPMSVIDARDLARRLNEANNEHLR